MREPATLGTSPLSFRAYLSASAKRIATAFSLAALGDRHNEG